MKVALTILVLSLFALSITVVGMLGGGVFGGFAVGFGAGLALILVWMSE